MASEAELSEMSSPFERLVRQRDLSLFVPFLFGLTNANPRTEEPETEAEDGAATARERIILINPFTQGMVVIEGTSSLEALLRGVSGKPGQPPASKASIEAMPSVEIVGGDGDSECAICLEEWEDGGVAKEMPCKHRFHGRCIEKWLGIHGSCPVCRYKMPVEEAEVGKRTVTVGDGDQEQGTERRVEREIWVSFSFNGVSGSERTTTSADSNTNTGADQHQLEG